MNILHDMFILISDIKVQITLWNIMVQCFSRISHMPGLVSSTRFLLARSASVY